MSPPAAMEEDQVLDNSSKSTSLAKLLFGVKYVCIFFTQIISAIGPWGTWQFRYVSLLGFVTMLSAWPSLMINFMNPPTDFWCAREDGDWEVEEWRRHSSPLVSAGGQPVHDQCNVWASQDRAQPEDNSTERCTAWEHDTTEFTKTVVQQWDLVCERESYRNYAQSVFFAGMTMGTFVLGVVSDRFGRKSALLPSCLLTSLIGIMLPIAPSVEAFVLLRFVHGFFKIGIFSVAFVWCMEVIGGEWQTYVGMGLNFPWVVAWLSLCLAGYLVPDWRWLQWATSVPGLASVSLFWVLPESPKWLLTAGKLQEAEDVVRQATAVNGRELKEDWKLQPINLNNNRLHEKKGTLLNLFQGKTVTMITLIVFFNWFANSFVYYGLTLNSGNLGGSYQLNFLISGLLELPSYAISLIVILKGGRKLPYIAMIMAGGLCLLATTLIERDAYPANWPIMVLAMAGKFFLTGTFGIIYVYSAELFPTIIRSIGVGTSSVFARVGGMVAPYIGSLDMVINPTFPIAIFGLTAFVAGLLVLLLPETKNRKLPDTLEEGMKRNNKKLKVPEHLGDEKEILREAVER